jgi:uncharacterized protein
MLHAIGQKREVFLDFLRGFALLGILAVNLPLLAEQQIIPSKYSDDVSRLIKATIAFFFTGKFFIIFSFVFGYGFSILIENLEKKNLNVKKIFSKRLIGLFCIGLFHAIFFYEGDILVTYAILGFFLFLIKDKTEETWKKYILMFWIISIFTNILLGVINFYQHSVVHDSLIEMAKTASIEKQGNFLQVALQRSKELFFAYPVIILYNWPSAFMMFIVGLLASKKKLLQNPQLIWEQAKGRKRYIFLIAVLTNLCYSQLESSKNLYLSMFFGSLLSVAGISLAFLYILVIIRIFFLQKTENFIVSLISNAGTMSLSNYLFQSIIAGFLFYGWGLGYYEKLSPLKYIIFIPLIYFLNLILSFFWKKISEIGPFEWVLRKWVYLKIEE